MFTGCFNDVSAAYEVFIQLSYAVFYIGFTLFLGLSYGIHPPVTIISKKTYFRFIG